MRSKKLRQRGNSFINSPEEAKKKQSTLGKYFYLTVLALLVFIIAQWAYGRIFYIKGVGFLESETTLIEARTPGRIVKINCKINDQVSERDPLVILSGSGFSNGTFHNVSAYGQNYYKKDRRIIESESEIKLLSQQINKTQEQISNLRGEYQRASELLVDNAVTRTKVLEIAEDLKTAEHELVLLNIKLDNELKILTSHEREFNLVPANNYGEFNLYPGFTNGEILYAPKNGVVSFVYKRKGEVAKIGEPILRIASQDQNYIKTYFAGAYEKSVVVGDEVKVYFENGEKSKGIIKEIYPTTLVQPPEFKQRFGSVKRFIIAKIVPKDFPAWDRILETKAKVLVTKKWFN